jgi:hypothetical protein
MLRAVGLSVAIVVTLAGCTNGASEPETLPTPSSSTTPVESVAMSIDVGHCWIDPVTFEGTTWWVTKRDQFGGGDAKYPDEFQATGTVTWVAKDELEYQDASGVRLALVPEGTRRAFSPEGRQCA